MSLPDADPTPADDGNGGDGGNAGGADSADDAANSALGGLDGMQGARPAHADLAAGAAAAGPGDDLLLFKLARVVNLSARNFMQRVGHAHRLTLNEWRVMVAVAARPGSSATQVADRCGLDKMSVSRALATLQEAGRLAREDDPHDLRSTRLYLSPSGQALYRVVRVGAQEREAQVMGALSPAEQARLGTMLDKLIESALHADR